MAIKFKLPKRGQVISALHHFSHSAFLGVLVLTFAIGRSVPVYDGIDAMATIVALLVVSLKTVGITALFLGSVLLILHWSSNRLPFGWTVRLYWILWSFVWFLTFAGVV